MYKYNKDFTEIEKLNEMLEMAGIPHTFKPFTTGIDYADGYQVKVFYDILLTEEFDDAVIHGYSHGCEDGLLETYHLSDCNGYETAVDVFKGWARRYYKHIAEQYE